MRRSVSRSRFSPTRCVMSALLVQCIEVELMLRFIPFLLLMITYLLGDCRQTLKTLPNESVHTCVTSPPYFGLRDYGADGQIGLDATPDLFVAKMVDVFREVRRVLRDDGTLWLNLGDSYASSGVLGGHGKTAIVGNTKKD